MSGLKAIGGDPAIHGFGLMAAGKLVREAKLTGFPVTGIM
jgi:hypothetical protein